MSVFICCKWRPCIRDQMWCWDFCKSLRFKAAWIERGTSFYFFWIESISIRNLEYMYWIVYWLILEFQRRPIFQSKTTRTGRIIINKSWFAHHQLNLPRGQLNFKVIIVVRLRPFLVLALGSSEEKFDIFQHYLYKV